eukprot:Lithocolla_globosa_v1_NODE_895_length_3120_cov_46.944535.p1 type:complete len:447 gc:universal NODE_895_length_3120_cov_46.944535:1499-159(-)
MPSAIIIAPSRELAEQTFVELGKFKKYLGGPALIEALFVGGIPVKQQIQVLEKGVDIVVGTPGRLNELITNNYIPLEEVRFLVLDEADDLITRGDASMIQNLYSKIPKTTPTKKRLQVLLFSATLHSMPVKNFANLITQFPTWVDLKGQDYVPETVHHVKVSIDPNSKWIRSFGRNVKKPIQTDGVHERDNKSNSSPEALSEQVKICKGNVLLALIETHNMDQAMIFCRTKVDCDNCERFLQANSPSKALYGSELCVCLHSDKSPQQRQENLAMFKAGESKFLICTDVAARGIDIKGLPYVINYTLPDETPNYLHRIGRVGRADRMGLAFSLVSTVKEKVWYHSCPSRGKNCNKMSCTIWYDEPSYIKGVEEHLDMAIDELDEGLQVPGGTLTAADGKVVYGAKRDPNSRVKYPNHAAQLAPVVSALSNMEKDAQLCFLNLKNKKW